MKDHHLELNSGLLGQIPEEIRCMEFCNMTQWGLFETSHLIEPCDF